jgi:Domain of unknown function (DUF4145)
VQAVAKLGLTHAGRAVAMLWFHRHTQAFEERSVGDLAADLHVAGFPKPNVTRLATGLRATKCVIKGSRPGLVQIDVRQLDALDGKYLPLIGEKKVIVHGALLPTELVAGTRAYLERLFHQINACYEAGLLDASAVLCRRLMESLIIEVYIHAKRSQDIQGGGTFFPLEKLIAVIHADPGVSLGRHSHKAMRDLKDLGDTAAHDRTYITTKQDLDDIKASMRRLVQELLSLSGIMK